MSRQPITERAVELTDQATQKWYRNSHGDYTDQFGNLIHANKPKYSISMFGQPKLIVYSLTAAKLISAVLLNDQILNKPAGE